MLSRMAYALGRGRRVEALGGRLAPPGGTTKAEWTRATHLYADGIVEGVETLTLRPRRAVTPAALAARAARVVSATGAAKPPDGVGEDVISAAEGETDNRGGSQGGRRVRSAHGALQTRAGDSVALDQMDPGQLEAHVAHLKSVAGRVSAARQEKETEWERLARAQGRAQEEGREVEEVEQELQDFRTRVEARMAATQRSVEGLKEQRSALEEVERRMRAANKGLQQRVMECKEEQRVLHADLRDLGALAQEVTAAREAALANLAELRKQVTDDRARCETDLTRRQSKVETLLAETRARGERLQEQERQWQAQRLEAEVEQQLARERALESGRSVGQELDAIRARKGVDGGGDAEVAVRAAEEEERAALQERAEHLQDAWEKFVAVTRIEGGEAAAQASQFLFKARERIATLEGMGEELEKRAVKLRAQADAAERRSQAAKEAALGERSAGDAAGPEEAAMEAEEAALAEYAASNRAVAGALGQLVADFASWASRVLGRVVMLSDDESMLRGALRLSQLLRPRRESLARGPRASGTGLRGSTKEFDGEGAYDAQIAASQAAAEEARADRLERFAEVAISVLQDAFAGMERATAAAKQPSPRAAVHVGDAPQYAEGRKLIALSGGSGRASELTVSIQRGEAPTRMAALT